MATIVKFRRMRTFVIISKQVREEINRTYGRYFPGFRPHKRAFKQEVFWRLYFKINGL